MAAVDRGGVFVAGWLRTLTAFSFQTRTTPNAGSTRSYAWFTDVIDDTINGRILNGFHFRTPDVQGAWIGKKAAQWVDKRFFEPVD